MPHVHRWDIGRPQLLLHILHGMAEHGARYARLASELNAHSIAVWAHDHRGHGLTATAGDLGHFGDADGWRLVVDDAWGVSREMMATYPGVSIALFAHSMGSFIGQMSPVFSSRRQAATFAIEPGRVSHNYFVICSR